MSAVDPRRPLPASAAVLELARAALIRTGRGRGLWVMAGIAVLPAIMAMVLARAGGGLDERSWEKVFVLCLLMLVVIPPVLVASAVADEVEEKTASYLWSRALPRWTVIIGKLLGMAPVVALLMGGSAVGAYLAGDLGRVVTSAQLVDGVVGLAAAGVAASAIAAMIATLIPRHAVAVTVGWMVLVDGPLGALDISLSHLSTTYGASAIGGFIPNASDASGAITLAVLAAIATGVACWRVGRME